MRRVESGYKILIVWGPVVLVVAGLLFTGLGMVLPGAVHAAAVIFGFLAIVAHLFSTGVMMASPALGAITSRRRRIVVRWFARVARLAVLGWAYPVVAVPGFGVFVPALGCAALVAAQRWYLLTQLRRDRDGVPLPGLEVGRRVGAAVVRVACLIGALVAAALLGLTVQYLIDLFGGLPAHSVGG
jgi:hypothetical protein